MFVIDMEASLRRLDEELKRLDELYARIDRALARHEVYSPYCDLFSRKAEEAKRREQLLNKANHLFQLIRFMIKHNHILKRNRLFQLGEMFNLYRNIQQSRIDELNLVMDEKIIIKRENKERGELQWQQVFA